MPRHGGVTTRFTAEFFATLLITLGTLTPAAFYAGLHLHLGYAVTAFCTAIGMLGAVALMWLVQGAQTEEEFESNG